MLRCQFLCHVIKALFFIKIALKLSYFGKKMQNFRAPPPDPHAFGGWSRCPHTPKHSPSLRISGYAPGIDLDHMLHKTKLI